MTYCQMEYNEKFSKFFEKFKDEYIRADEEWKRMLLDIARDFVEKNRDFVMHHPLISYWRNFERSIGYSREQLYKEYNWKNINLYFHVPFCVTKCSYCNFHITIWNRFKKLHAMRYLKKMEMEVDAFLDEVNIFNVKTIFIWWGTPSFLDDEELTTLLKMIYSRFSHKFDKAEFEYTIECNPESVTKSKLQIFKEFWINRISLWVQSFNDDVIKNINRTYTEEDVLRTVSLIREEWFGNMNIDMMYGLPTQEAGEMRSDLEKIIKMNPEHITYYPLYNYEESTFGRMWKKEDNIEEIYSFYDILAKSIKDAGYIQYWREYFAKDESLIHHYQNNYVSNRHLIWFWHSAYSFSGKFAFCNTHDFKDYMLWDDHIRKMFEYHAKFYDERLFVIWSRNLKIDKKWIKNLDYMRWKLELAFMLWFIDERENDFIFTEKWLKYQEIFTHTIL
ncbi:MAG: hypothetical protein ACD_3C00051G0015 [uncultured bacterium (gcode 4)]|uniref:Radical SAM core domain-containing protein n=1 Tax=uncultured bacterium (gcode 4) TaxID=1234023 RepID=K2G2M3_9BACT|nr:MAG: hypothetical protein ACD_3C00051G0015 [uncultured bacterium (gcode 4)]